MGTVASLDLRASGDHAAAVAEALTWLHRVDERYSPYRPESLVTMIGDGGLDPLDADDELRDILERCASLHVATDGWFDTTVNGRFDPSALVKGWATQRAADLLVEHGLTDFSLAVGGDVVTRGRPAAGARWRIGVQHPFDRDALATSFSAGDLAVATSGAYERGGHIRDPHTGAPATALVSVTVCGPDLGDADAYSTAAFAMGSAGPGWLLALARRADYEAYCVTADGRVLTTPGFPRDGAATPRITVVPASPLSLLGLS